MLLGLLNADITILNGCIITLLFSVVMSMDSPDNRVFTHMSAGKVVKVEEIDKSSTELAHKLTNLLSWFNRNKPVDETTTINSSYGGLLKMEETKVVPDHLAITIDDIRPSILNREVRRTL